MEIIVLPMLLLVFGLLFGSFAGAQVWRLRAQQLVEDVAEGEVVDRAEFKRLKPLTGSTLTTDRSRCLHCQHTLAWYDLLPLVSWLLLGGRCRYCKAPIGTFEPLMELAVAGGFVVSYFAWPLSLAEPYGIVQLLLWLVAVVLLTILFAYDLKWFLLPDSIVFPLIGVGAAMSAISLMTASELTPALLSLGGAVAILSGLYYALWLVSKGEWVGFGDVKLGLALALLLADWRLAAVALFSANLIGSLLVLPGLLLGKVQRGTHVPFGPLLIIGAAIAMLAGEAIAEAYQTLVL